MSSDALHEALTKWAAQPDAYTFTAAVMSNIDKEDAFKLIPMFLHVEREWLEEHTTPDEAYGVFKEAVMLNDWTEILQTMMVLDTIRLEEVMTLWQTAKAS